MNLDELTPLSVYCANEKLTFRQVIALAVGNKLEVFYVFDRWTQVSYVLEQDFIDGVVSDKNAHEAPSYTEKEYDISDVQLLTGGYLKALWQVGTNDSYMVSFEELFSRGAPAGYVLNDTCRERDDGEITDNLFVNTKANNRSALKSGLAKGAERPSATSLKVIGLFMWHLAKTPKYASGTSPNKSQIKELLLDLAEELDVNNYGLSKVDERLLADAMRYLETQKN